ncbi:HepT-like ribonuclease domain-containing protein [uncultured Campylobacter sp.]|uniref:HepT-like ribonuclease domain-containing protein n=1 Tax=uncultured Campylobacter sp. TaxID=218934 RepID=UPI0026085846|nr:HepT-like ribonuclease domain-containing protein [uncultured Campylobacter sp.]
MYNKRNLQRLELICKKIDAIQQICKIGVEKALADELRDRVIMHLISCNEQLQKIQDSGDIEILSIFAPSDVAGFRGIRNASAHDYEGLNLAIVQSVISDYLPNIKQNIDKFLKNKI